MFKPIADSGLGGFKPNTIDRVNVLGDARGNDGARSIDDQKAVIGVHNGPDSTVGLLGVQRSMDVEQRLLSVIPGANDLMRSRTTS